MKDKTNKKHKESTIGKIIYGFMLFAPLLAIGITCLVTTFNKNINIEEQQEYTITVINDYENLQRGKNYYFNSQDLNAIQDTTQHYTTIFVNNIKIEQSGFNTEQINNIENSCTYFRVYRQQNYNNKGYCLIYFFDNNNNTILNISITTSYTIILKFNFDKILQENNYQYLNNSIYEKTYTNVNTQNIFYYAIDQVENSTLFNWSKNNIIYTGLQATCETLSITNTFIPMLMTYWLITSILYFLYDIVLMMLNVLHRKIHELQDSI